MVGEFANPYLPILPLVKFILNVPMVMFRVIPGLLHCLEKFVWAVSNVTCAQYTVWTVVHEIGWLQDWSSGHKQELIGWIWYDSRGRRSAS